MTWLSAISSQPVDEIAVGIDGCGVPVFAMPHRRIAAAYMRLACPETIAVPELSAAASRIGSLINEYPLMMRGTGLLCSVINEDANIVGKGGAEGVYGFGLRAERLGVSIKHEDGSEGAWPVTIAETLRQLGYKDQATFAKLEGLAPLTKVNDNDTEVGYIEPVFELKKAA
jgi:L-asparaginase II